MLAITRLALILTTLSASIILASKSCRQCSGLLTVTFDDFAVRTLADEVFKSNLDGCATGNQYDILDVRSDGLCDTTTKPFACKKWVYSVKVWRYCGNGSNVLKGKAEPRLSFRCRGGGLCSASSYLSMTCNPSVECRGSCAGLQC